MSTFSQNSGQAGEHAPDDAHTPPHVSPCDYVAAVGLTVIVVLTILYLGGSVE